MEQIEKIQGTEKEFIKVFQELCYSRSSWHDFFRNLSKPLQDEIINRTEQSFE